MSLHRNIGKIGATETQVFTDGSSVIIVVDGQVKYRYPFDSVEASSYDIANLPMIPEGYDYAGYSSTALNTAEQPTATVYVTGYVTDKKTGNPLPTTIQLFFVNTLLKATDPFFVADGYYSAWTDQNPKNIAVRFVSEGYKDKLVTIFDLLHEPDILLEKGNAMSYTPVLLGLLLLAIAAKKKKKRVGAIDTGTVLAVGTGIVFLKGFGLFNDFLKFLGVNKGEGTKGAETESSNPDSAFKPVYWQQFTSFPNGAFTETQAKDFGKTIYNAFSVFQDDFNKIFSVFSQMRSKANVSFLAWEFNKQYNIDLLNFLRDGGGVLPWDGLSESHLKTIIDLVNSLPTN